jgi:hypothetical protein
MATSQPRVHFHMVEEWYNPVVTSIRQLSVKLESLEAGFSHPQTVDSCSPPRLMGWNLGALAAWAGKTLALLGDLVASKTHE